MSLPFIPKKNKSVSCFPCLQTYYTRRTKENKNEDTDIETDANMDTDKKEPVIYTKTGEASQNVIGLSISISVSV